MPDELQRQFVSAFKQQALRDLAARIALHTYGIQLCQVKDTAEDGKEILQWLDETKSGVSLAMGLQLGARTERPPPSPGELPPEPEPESA